MPAHDYEFSTAWKVEGTLGEVSSILKNVEAFPQWWRPVYISATVVEVGEVDGLGRRVDFVTRGFLPYMLRWQLCVLESRDPFGFNFRASGDLVGLGHLELQPNGTFVGVRLGWKVRAEKALLRRLSFLLRSVFARNHAWAMARGQSGLQIEILRQRSRPGQQTGNVN